MLLSLLLVFLAYLVGAIPTGVVFCKLLFNKIITEHGSGNIGASNVGRVLGKRYFFPVFIIDALKAYLVLFFALWIYPEQPIFLTYLLAATVLLGNGFSLFIKFKGGKGVATTFGIIGFLCPWYILICFATSWVLIALLIKKPFIASLATCSATILLLCALGQYDHVLFLSGVLAWLTYRHLPNFGGWCKKCCPCPWRKI